MRTNTQPKNQIATRKPTILGYIGALFLIFSFWFVSSHLFDIPNYLLPTPNEVLLSFSKNKSLLLNGFIVTAFEAFMGFMLSIILSIMIAVAITLKRNSEPYIMPVLIMLKSIPIIALAPLIGFWFGYGYSGKILMSMLISLLPLTINLITGMESVNREKLDFFKVMNSSKIAELVKLRIPTSLPFMFSGMKVAAPLAVVGAIIAEMMGAREGLGHTLSITLMTIDMPLNFASMITAGVLGMISYYAIVFVEIFVIRRLRFNTIR